MKYRVTVCFSLLVMPGRISYSQPPFSLRKRTQPYVKLAGWRGRQGPIPPHAWGETSEEAG